LKNKIDFFKKIKIVKTKIKSKERKKPLFK